MATLILKNNKAVEKAPKLRFPEFSREWKDKTLGSIAQFSKGKGISKSDIIENGDLECIRYGELYTTYDEVINNVKSRTNIDPEDLVLSEVNDVIIPASGETQIDIATASCVLNSGVALGGDLNIIKTPMNGVFLSYYLNNRKKKDIARLSQGISVVHLYSHQLKILTLFLPDEPEQQKIASFLSVVDKKIQQLTRKKELLEQYKKGVMQKLFSQEIRFKDENGEDYPDWEEKRLRELVHFVNGKAHEKDISESGKYVVINSKFISSEGCVRKYTDTQICPLKLGDLVMVMSDVPKGKALAKCFYIDKDSTYTLNQRIAALKQKKADTKFLYYLVNRNKYYLAFDSGVGHTNLRKDEVLNCPLYLPRSIEEQQKISSFLSNIDNKVNALKIKIEQTQQFKKGLLQQMFV